MNDFFSWKRLRTLAVKQYAQDWKFYLVGLLGIGCVIGILYYMYSFNPSDGDCITVFATAGYIVWIFRGLKRSMRPYVDRSSRVLSTTLPASVAEKYAVAWFNSFVLGSLIYFGVWWIADTLCRIFAGFSILPGLMQGFSAGYFWSAVFCGVLLFHAVAFLCHVACGKRGAVVFMLVCAGAILYVVLANKIFGWLSGDPLSSFSGTSLRAVIQTQNTRLTYVVDWPFFSLFVSRAGCLLIFAVWTVAGYFKFKERQIK